MLTIGKLGISGSRILSVGRGVSVGGGGGQPQPFVGPYDAIPSIAALYAVRRALSDYTGPILRLRRDSDNTEQDIGYVANGDLDTAALASWLGEANGYITTWYDQSGNGHHATQATAAAQPLYVASGQNSRPVLRFDGTDDGLLCVMSTLAQPNTMICVGKANNKARAYKFIGNRTTSTENVLTQVAPSGVLRMYAGASLDGAEDRSGQWFVAVALFNTANSRLRVNGVVGGTGNAGSQSMSGLALGYGDVSVDKQRLLGDMAEVVVCHAALSEADYLAAESAAATYWGVTLA